MKAQFKSLQAAHVNNVVAQSSVQQLQQTTAQPTIQNITNFSKQETELQNEVKNLKQELQIKNNQLASVQNNHKNILDLFNKTSEEVVKQKQDISSLRLSIKALEEKEKQLTESNTNNLDSLVKSNSLLMQIIENKDKEIAALKNELSNSQVISSEISAIDAIEQDNVQHVQQVQPINLNNLQTFESILIENSNPNISQQQIDISYGEPILNQHGQPILGGAQPQLMGDSSQDFSIIDHQD